MTQITPELIDSLVDEAFIAFRGIVLTVEFHPISGDSFDFATGTLNSSGDPVDIEVIPLALSGDATTVRTQKYVVRSKDISLENYSYFLHAGKKYSIEDFTYNLGVTELTVKVPNSA